MALPLIALIPLVASGFTAIKDLICKFWPNAEDKAKVEQIKAEVKVIEDQIQERVREHEEIVSQLQINLEEAKSNNMFVAGWRPALGWTCATAWFVDIIIIPITNWCLSVFAPATKLMAGLPTDKLDIVMWLTAGLAGIRMIDKGVSKYQSMKDCK